MQNGTRNGMTKRMSIGWSGSAHTSHQRDSGSIADVVYGSTMRFSPGTIFYYYKSNIHNTI